MPRPEQRSFSPRGEKYDATMAFLSNELAKLGQHLPKERLPLSSLLEADSPGYVSRNGEFYRMRQEELEKIADFVPKDIYNQIRLPIIFLKEKNRFQLSGNKAEACLIERVLGNTEEFPALLEIAKPKKEYYNYEFQKIRRLLPTLVVFAIVRLS
ncbi:MAG: DUF61 family protein [Candidatus Thorarchaeota archaeon]